MNRKRIEREKQGEARDETKFLWRCNDAGGCIGWLNYELPVDCESGNEDA